MGLTGCELCTGNLKVSYHVIVGCVNMMSIQPLLKGVPGILRPFKEYLETNRFQKGDQVVYYGVPGTCTPFIELLAFAVRGLALDQVFVPYFKEELARPIVFHDGIGSRFQPARWSCFPGHKS